jgi:RecA-family ATPase
MADPDYTIEEDFPGDNIAGAGAGGNGHDTRANDEQAGQSTQEPLPFIDMSNWDNEDVPPREWAVRDMIPLRAPFLLSGEGAAGKTLLALQLGVAHALGRDWIGTLPEKRPFLFLGAEDEPDELHRRLHDILNSYGATFSDIKDSVHILSYAGEDAVLAHTDKRTGLVMPTPLFERLMKAATEIKPVMICLDTSADVFAGDEISRFEVRQFVGLLRKLAIKANAAVVITSHPSLTGINSGTGLSGSTGWHNSVRARAYLTTLKTKDDEEPDPSIRQLEFKKNNYGPISRSIPLRWEHGVFKLVGGADSFDKMAREQTAERLFVALLDRFNDQGRNVTDKPAAGNYGPTLFAKEDEAKKRSLRKTDLESAMRRLFAASAISVQPYGPPSRCTTRLVTR